MLSSLLRGVNWRDLALIESVPWYGLASIVLLIRHYQGLLFRVSYFLLLFYWFVFVSGGGLAQNTIYVKILAELLRSRDATYGETDSLGRHWTINIAEIIITTLLDVVLGHFFSGWIWNRVVFGLVLSQLVFGHYVFQLFLHKQITRIVRFNQAMFKWRDYGVEYFWYGINYHLNHRVMRVLVFTWWWTCHQIYQYLTPEVMNRLSSNLIILNIMHRMFYGPVPWLSYAIRWMLVYRVWLRELARFSNPDPPMYKYSKLEKPDHIRLILLHPRFGFRPISCTLVQGPHMRLLFYEAISYTWG